MLKLINVANRLPVTLTADGNLMKSSGGLVAALEGLTAGDDLELHWIGWPGSPIAPERQEEVRQSLQREHRASPVFLTAEQSTKFYEGFANSSLWPLLHYMPSKFRYESGWWPHYQQVNRAFADAVLEQADDGDLVWVHDYQLMLVPAMLKHDRPSLKVGFFLHTPFPSYEIFRCHPNRRELMEGLLGADQIGFHTFGYLRHFRSSVLRVLGTDSEMTRIAHDGHAAHLGIYPIGINAPRFREQLATEEHRRQSEETRNTFGHKRLILSVERMDYTKGILHRLDAVELFLQDLEDRDSVKFIIINIPSRENVEEYKELVEDVEHRVGRINGRFATLRNSPVHFIHQSVSFAQLCALYALADVAIVTPLIDGMNLVAKEFVACQQEEPGTLILSEFAGAAEELFSALIVNPYDASAVARAIGEALEMPAEDRRARMEPMRRRVMTHDARVWAGRFIDDLKSRNGHAPPAPDLAEARAAICDTLSSDKRVAMFLDYDGTLREIERRPRLAAPHQQVYELLGALMRVPSLAVTIVSGRTADDLEGWLGLYPVGLIAEHGASLRRPGRAEWEDLARNIDFAWKDELLKIFRLYEAATPGSFVEVKRTSLVWHYRQADPEFGDWKARHLATELQAIVANEPLKVRQGRKIVEVTVTTINKGAAIRHVLETTPADAVLVAGDDTTDEDMFRLDLPNLLSLKVGRPPTQARYVLPSPHALRRFLLDCLPVTVHQ